MNITKSLAASTVVFQRRWKKGSALENFMSDIHVDEWRIYWRGLRYAFIAETIPGMLCKEMMSMLGFLSKSYFFRFQVIPGFITVSKLMAEGCFPKEALEEYARLYYVWGRGKPS